MIVIAFFELILKDDSVALVIFGDKIDAERPRCLFTFDVRKIDVNDVVYDVNVVFEPALSLDVKPADCPNLLTTNIRGKGRLPMAIVGTDTFDVNDIDLDTISIGGTIFPVKAPNITGVTSPASGDPCGCLVAGDDGVADVALKFSRRAVILGLGLDLLPPGTVVPITVEGLLHTGTEFSVTDCVELEAPSRTSGGPRRSQAPALDR